MPSAPWAWRFIAAGFTAAQVLELIAAAALSTVANFSGRLTRAIGRVMRDAVGGLANIYRHMAGGERPYTAIVNGSREVPIASVGATATTVAVFLPLGLVGGLIGQLFLPFALAVGIEVLQVNMHSYVVASQFDAATFAISSSSCACRPRASCCSVAVATRIAACSAC